MSKEERNPEQTNGQTRVVVYDYGGNKAVYIDGKLKGKYSSYFSWKDVLYFVGISAEERSVRWEDMPLNYKVGASTAIGPPFDNLEDMERHFAEVERHKRTERIEHLKAELSRLESGG